MEERIGSHSYKLALPYECWIHNVSHVSLQERFCTDRFQQVSPTDETSTTLEEINEPVYQVENILRWRHKKIKNKSIREFLVLWAGYPLEEAAWDPKHNFADKEALHKDL